MYRPSLGSDSRVRSEGALLGGVLRGSVTIWCEVLVGGGSGECCKGQGASNLGLKS